MPAWKVRWLDEAIASILSQTYAEIELVIIDDCSPEDIEGVTKRHTDPRLRYYRNAENIGGKHLTKQWEHCLQYARGQWVVIAADDDIYRPTFVEEAVRLAQLYPEVNIIRTACEEIDEQGRLLDVEYFQSPPSDHISQLEYIWAYREGRVFICMGNFLFRRSALRAQGFVDFPRALGSDIATTIDLARQGMALTGQPLFAFRHSEVHLSGSTTQFAPKMEAISQFFEWMERYPLPEAKTPYEVLFRQQILSGGWREKATYDYYNQVLRYLPLTQFFSYLGKARLATTKDKLKFVLRWLLSSVM